SGGDSGEEPGGESGGESGGETDAPDYTGGKLIADYNLNKDFANSTLGQMVIVETFDKAVDGFEATYSDDGITITQTNEGTENTSINKFALNLVTVVDEDKKNNTATYQTGVSGIYALELTMQLDSSSSSKRIDMYFNSKRAVTVGPVTTANNFRIMTNKSAYFQNATDGRNVDKWTEGEDWTLRFVVDTFKHEIYGYNVDKDGNCTYKFTAPYTLNSFGSVTYAPRLYLPQDFFVTFKNMKIYEIKKDTEGMANLFGDTFIASLPETLVPDPENVSESFTMPSTTSTVKSSNENVVGVNGTVINSFEDKYEYIKFTSNVGDVYYDKIYNLLIKAREDISVKNIATYDYSNEEDFDTLKELGDGKITDNGYEIANTSTNSGVVGILKAEYSSDSNTKTYYFDHKGAQDFEINLNPELTTGAGYVEVGNYNEKNGEFVPFGSVKFTPNGIEYIDEKEDVVVATEATNGKDYSLKFRTFVNEKKIWLFVNDNKFSETPFSYSNGSPLNAFRIYMEGADTNDTILIKNAELVQQIYGVPAKNCLDAISTVTTNTITNNPMDAYGNINLPVIEGYNVVWSTNNPLADLVNKKIYRSTEEENITIFAHVSKVSDPSVYVIKEFYLKVKAASNEKELLEGALAKITAESLTNQDINSIIADLELPSKTEEGYTITWDSLNDDIISDRGVINKNINISKNTEVVLKATVSSGSVSDSKEIKFTIAKRGKDILVNPSVLVEDVSDVVTYSAEVGTNAGNAYLCDEAGNKIIGFKILDSKLSLEYKNAPVNEFEITDATNIKFVMNSNHGKVSVYADNNLLADYVPYLENATGFNKVTNNGLAINNQNVIFDEYSLINYNVKVYDYFEVISKGYITENVELKKASLGGVKVEWDSSNDTILSVDGSFEAPTMITNFEITATLSVNGGTGAKLVEVIKCVAVPDENSNLFNNAKIASNMTEDVVNDRTKAIDGDLNTYFVATSLKEKSQITIDMGVMKDINSLYFFRDADDENVNSCEIYVSKDGKEWGTPVAVHTFAGIESNQVVFELQNARYIKITNINTDDKTIKLYEVKGYISYSSDDKAHIDIAALEMPEGYILTTEKLVLPTIGSVYGSKLTWTSSDTSVISLDGTVKKPSSKTEVVLTVTAELDGKKSVKSFIYLVNGKASAGGGASGGGGGGSVNTSGIHTGGAGIAALPTEPTIEQKPSDENLKTEFVDVKVSDWYYTYLIDLKNKGIVSGYDDGSFKPANTVTREEFIKMIISAAGIELSAVNEGFEDVSANDWFAKYVYTAKENGIVNGIDENNFGTGRPVSRQDMSVIICNILNKETMTSDEVFADDENIASYAKNAVYTMKALEVLNGYEDGTFNPSGNLTRAEAVKVISIVLKLM
ncbi:MAG: S-layer homology domain-containing protein, partial [Clostridia bacterium]|nr:S-layer homology domain-containing protein [Clostridia bacterium]